MLERAAKRLEVLDRPAFRQFDLYQVRRQAKGRASVGQAEENVRVAKELYDLLVVRDVSVWFSENDIGLGEPFLRAIDKGLAKSRIGIVQSDARPSVMICTGNDRRAGARFG